MGSVDVESVTNLSESPCQLLTRSLELIQNMLFASVATALARYVIPIPGLTARDYQLLERTDE